jgi:urease accessory protein
MKQSSLNRFAILAAALSWLVPHLASAHVGIGSTGGFLAGMSHPLGGLDHLCAMLAVGLWAAQRGPRTSWGIPLAFVSVMAMGAALGMAGVVLPFTETGIVVSVLILGILVAASVRLPLAVSMMMVGLFAVFHGHAHGTEMPAMASGLAYGAGFVSATLFLHVCGMGLGLLARYLSRPLAIRFAGTAIAMFGGYLWLSA